MAGFGNDFPPSRSARRRHLTLLFSDLSDSTTLAGNVEPEDYLEVVDHLKRCAHAILRKHGGTLVDFRGDGLLAMFGFPESSEHDGRRATEAALELHEAIRRIPVRPSGSTIPSLNLHSGIHSGLVLLIEGDAATGGYALVGEAPSIAARLSDAAARDEILVSATTLGTESHFFEVCKRGDLVLQGKTAAVTAYQVVGRAPVSTRFEARSRHGLTPFTGRDAELALLDGVLRDSMAGRLRLVSVTGDAGVGKTRLVQEFLHTAALLGCTVYRGYCDDSGNAEPLQPLLQILRAVCKLAPGAFGASPVDDLEGRVSRDPELAGVGTELVRAATLAFAIRGSSHLRQSAVAGVAPAMRDLFSALTGIRPVILFIDDWQWADDASREVLAAVRELTQRPLLILTTSRSVRREDAALSESDVEVRLVLAPLDEEGTARTIRALRSAADPFVVRRFQRLSGGNPLFIEELCLSAERDTFEAHSDRVSASPAWLNTLIESRVARLPADEAALVRTAAIAGTVIPSWLLEQLTGLTEDDPSVRNLAKKDLVFPEDGGTFRFKHGVTREVIYQSVGLREREHTHLRIAELLREHCARGGHDELFESLAYHYRAAAKRDLAADYAERAGDKALAAAALDRARAQYCAALDLLDLSDATYARWISIAQRLGLACVYDPARDQLPIFRRAVEAAYARGDEAALARAEYWLGYINYALGEVTASIHHCERAREYSTRALAAARRESPDAPPVELEAHAVQVLATLGQARAAACEHEGVLEQLEQAIAVKRRHRSGRRPAVGFAYTLACKGWVLGDYGRFAEAHDCFREAIDAVREGNQPVRASVLGWQAAVYLWQGRWSDALSASTEAQRLAERVESLYILAMNQALSEYARWMLDRAPEALDTIIRATSWVETRDKRLFISLSYGWLAEVTAATGRHREARAYAARTLRRAREGDVFGAAMAYRALARLPGGDRRPPPERYLRAAIRAAQARRSPHEEAVTLLHWAELEAERGHGAEASQLRGRACAAFSAMEMRWHERRAGRLVTPS